MVYNFDEVIDRKGSNCVKYDIVKDIWGRDDLIPLWVADMDFRTPPFIMDALRKRLDHEILGYTCNVPEWKPAIINWQRDQHQWDVKPQEITFIPGIVRGIAFVLQALTQPGDKILVMNPVYHPFFLVAQHNGREVVYNKLSLKGNQYYIDFAQLEKDLEGTKVFILSNPHNPGGRVWRREELAKIADLCKASGTIVVSDEIHADLTLKPYKHVPFATVSEAANQNCITFGAPSKAFNTPGIASSYAIVPNREIRHKFIEYLEASELSMGNMFAQLTCVAAYTNGTEWLDQVKDYISENIDFTEKYLEEYIPQISIVRPQASYLIYLNCRGLNLPQEELKKLFVDKAHLALNDGEMFGTEGTGFMRLNVACPRSVLAQALSQLRQAVAEIS